MGRYGPFLEQGDRRAALPDQMPPDELTLDAALEMLDKASQGEEPLGTCPETQQPIFVKVGRFGPYVQRGTGEDDEKPQNASLLKGMQAEDVTLELALKLLSLPRTLGPHPATAEPVVAHNGRYGPYVKCGEETRSLPGGLSPLDVTLEQALDLLAQPKSGRGRAARKEPLKTFDPSPVTGKPVQLLGGRYGPYVTDGATNASLPRGTSAEEVTLGLCLESFEGPRRAWAVGASCSSPPRRRPGRRQTGREEAGQEGRQEKGPAKEGGQEEGRRDRHGRRSKGLVLHLYPLPVGRDVPGSQLCWKRADQCHEWKHSPGASGAISWPRYWLHCHVSHLAHSGSHCGAWSDFLESSG